MKLYFMMDVKPLNVLLYTAYEETSSYNIGRRRLDYYSCATISDGNYGNYWHRYDRLQRNLTAWCILAARSCKIDSPFIFCTQIFCAG